MHDARGVSDGSELTAAREGIVLVTGETTQLVRLADVVIEEAAG